MKKIIGKIRLITVLGIMVLMTQSCICSLYPLYTEDNLVFDKNLIGTWIENDSTEYKIDVAKSKNKNKTDSIYYTLTFKEGKTAEFDIHLLKLEKYYYIDCILNNYETENSMVDSQIFPIHTFARVQIKKDSITMEAFNYNFIKKLIKENKIRIKYEAPDDRLILTGSSEDMQKFITKYADHKDIFETPSTLKRKK